MTIKEMIERYNLCLITYGPNKGKIMARNQTLVIKDNAFDSIKGKKEEIKSILEAEHEAEQVKRRERQAKIDAIEGLKEIQKANEDIEEWHKKFNASFEGTNAVGGFNVGPKPDHDVDALESKYPRAAAYLKAQRWSNAANYAKSSAGNRALKKIINGEDYESAIATMESEWSAHCDEHMWD